MKMNNFVRFLGVVLMALFLSGCGEFVEVPPAHVGKVLTKNGYKPETVPPSRFRLPFCVVYCDSLIVSELSDTGMKESFKLFMPKDQLNMSFDVRFTMSIRDDQKSVDTIFDRVPSNRMISNDNSNVRYVHGIIPSIKVYRIYGQPVLREVIRTVVAGYKINEIASSRESINAEVYEKVSAALNGTPIAVKRLAFADIQFPEVVVNAKVKAAERRAEIQQVEAERQVVLVKMNTRLESAKAERAVRRERALAAKEENAIFSESVTEKYLSYKRLEVLLAMAENSNTVFVPFEALGNLGLSNKIFNPATPNPSLNGNKVPRVD